MKQTNYQLVDFLDFDSALSGEELLWNAGPPAGIEERGTDVIVRIPFQRQLPSIELQPDPGAAPREYQMILRAYGERILRVFIDFSQCLTAAPGASPAEAGAVPGAGPVREEGGEPGHDSPLLEMDPHLQVSPLRVEIREDQWTVRDHRGKPRAVFNRKAHPTEHWSDLLPAPVPDLEAVFCPAGEKEVRISAWDQFFPSRKDALSLGLVERKGVPDRAAISFHAKQGEKFAGTGERFAKMDLSGRTFQLRNQDGQGVNNRRTYKNVPFYLSSEGYGLFLHTTAYAKLSLADHSSRSVQLMAEQPVLDLFLIGGDSPEKLLYEYRRLTGFPARPPLWSFGI
ncbi:MAG TPA: hypothetical protein VD772_05305, partial [Anseongella sp.]|nr:hypothetical protein [Anseongella sp.]